MGVSIFAELCQLRTSMFCHRPKSMIVISWSDRAPVHTFRFLRSVGVAEGGLIAAGNAVVVLLRRGGHGFDLRKMIE